MAAVFQLDVLAASVPFFQGKCVSAVIPVTDGEYGVLAGHSNAVGAVCAGEHRQRPGLVAKAEVDLVEGDHLSRARKSRSTSCS